MKGALTWTSMDVNTTTRVDSVDRRLFGIVQSGRCNINFDQENCIDVDVDRSQSMLNK